MGNPSSTPHPLTHEGLALFVRRRDAALLRPQRDINLVRRSAHPAGRAFYFIGVLYYKIKKTPAAVMTPEVFIFVLLNFSRTCLIGHIP